MMNLFFEPLIKLLMNQSESNKIKNSTTIKPIQYIRSHSKSQLRLLLIPYTMYE